MTAAELTEACAQFQGPWNRLRTGAVVVYVVALLLLQVLPG